VNAQILRPGNIAIAALVIGGILVLVLPQHGLDIVGLVIVTAAAAAGLFVLGVHAPPTWWRSPFDTASGVIPNGDRPRDIERIRPTLYGWRQPLASGPPLPPAVLRLLRPLVEVAAERAGLDAGGRPSPGHDADPLPPLLRAVLRCDPWKPVPWFRRIRPDAREVAAAVNGILDEIDRLTGNIAGGPEAGTRSQRET
jgi:hypothetical protein